MCMGLHTNLNYGMAVNVIFISLTKSSYQVDIVSKHNVDVGIRGVIEYIESLTNV